MTLGMSCVDEAWVIWIVCRGGNCGGEVMVTVGIVF